MKNSFITILLLMCFTSVLAQEPISGDFNDEFFVYKIIDNNSVGLVSCYDTTHVVLTVPSQVLHDGKFYTVVGTYEFAFCKHPVLEQVHFPNTITKIDGPLFYRCNKLKTIKFPPFVEELPSAVFFTFDNNSLVSVDLPSNLKTIGDNAFCGSNLSSIRFPVSVTNIGSNAFGGTRIDTLEIPPFLCTGGDSYLFDAPHFSRTSINNIVADHNNYCYGIYPIGTAIETQRHTLELIQLTKTHSYAIAKGKPSRFIPQDYLLVYELGYLRIYNPNENSFWAAMLNYHYNDISIIDYLVLKDKIVVIFSTGLNETFIAGSYYFDGPSELQLQLESNHKSQNKLLCKHLPAKVEFVNNKSTVRLIENGKVIKTLNINDFVDKYTY